MGRNRQDGRNHNGEIRFPSKSSALSRSPDLAISAHLTPEAEIDEFYGRCLRRVGRNPYQSEESACRPGFKLEAAPNPLASAKLRHDTDAGVSTANCDDGLAAQSSGLGFRSPSRYGSDDAETCGRLLVRGALSATPLTASPGRRGRLVKFHDVPNTGM